MLGQHVRLRMPEKWRENTKRWASWIIKKSMAGKFNCTCNNGSKRNGGKIWNGETRGSSKNKRRENSTARETTEVKEKGGKIRNYTWISWSKNGGKILQHVRRGGGKWLENSKPPGSPEAKNGGNRGAGYVLPELAASWTRGLKVWTLVQVAVGSTHHLGVLQVALHIKQTGGICEILYWKHTLF